MLHSWLDSIQSDLQTTGLQINSMQFPAFYASCVHILTKTLQHFIYCKTQEFPDSTDLMHLLSECKRINHKIEAYEPGLREICKLQNMEFPDRCDCYPPGTSRHHYLDFCEELLAYILKLLSR